MLSGNLGKYRILEPLGAGGMGEVYLAEDTRLGRRVAIKVLPEAFTADPERVARLEQEARLLAALQHPNVATLFGLEEADGALFLVMELVEGESLAATIGRGAMVPAAAVGVAEQIATALEAAHARRIVHRDLKPANVMVTPQGQVKVLDFGIATAQASADDGSSDDTPTVIAVTAADSLLGTVAYMSPEQARGEPATPSTDIWGVGAILYEMLAGVQAFGGQNPLSTLQAIQTAAPRDAGRVELAVPAALWAIVQKALAKEPGARHGSMAELRADLTAAREQLEGVTRQPAIRTTPLFHRPVAIAASIALVVLAAWMIIQQRQRSAEQRWAREEGLPQIEALAQTVLPNGPADDAWRAVRLARRVEATLPGDAKLQELWEQIAASREMDPRIMAARPTIRGYGEDAGEQETLEAMPDGTVRVAVGLSRLRLQPEGREPRELVISGASLSGPFVDLLLNTAPPSGMVPVLGRPEGPNSMVILTGLGEPRQAFENFFIDRYEVTNREYQEFVDAGGYGNPAYWTDAIEQDGRQVDFDASRPLFVDSTGRPGPATWQLGRYPEAQDDYPVSGVSWYEARAYASFRGKQLPTVFHWDRAANAGSALAVIPASNLEGDGPMTVGRSNAMNTFGTYDMAGNVREWAVNLEASGSKRFILGGGWSDPGYAFTDAFAQSPLDRSPLNGIRLMQYEGAEPRRAEVERPLARPYRDFFAEEAADDATFEIYRRQFAYDRSPLHAEVVKAEEGDGWRWERVEFDAAYGNERMAAYVVTPANFEPPYQVVVEFPGSGALYGDTPEQRHAALRGNSFFVRTGRAHVLPIYKSTYDRQDNVKSDYANQSVEYREHLIMWIQDFSRTVDYLETREDIDASRLAYYGISWGGYMGAQVPAIEKRIKAVVLYVAGLSFERALPEVDPINYVGRITQPVLMVNGQYDYFFPVETAQRPMFERLGTPPADKKWLVFPGTHSAPFNELVRNALAWLDTYLGPVAD